MTEREFYRAIVGKDENGEPKAMCSVSVLMPDKKGEPVCIEDMATLTGTVSLAIIPNGLSVIDVVFEDALDYDYQKLCDICCKEFKMVVAANENGTAIPTLTLTVSRQGDFSAFMTCMNCVWGYLTETPDKLCTGIRFFMNTKDIHFLELTDEQVEKVLNELDAEYYAN